MGEFLNYRNEIYSKYLNFVKIDISKKYKFSKKDLNFKLESRVENYDKYIKKNIISNRNISHNEQIIMEIKKYFDNFKSE